MNRIMMLKNPVQEYAWGSKTVLQDLLGKPGSPEKPMAELWMGAHPKAPSRVLIDGKWSPLDKVIKRDPELVLGKSVASRFSNRLPFLFKVLAVDAPLSIQTHPSLDQARAGFKRENSLGIPLDSPVRNYKDNNHKPEILCAITPFQGLKGFRKIEEILSLMDKVSFSSLSDELSSFKKKPDIHGLEDFFIALMRMDKTRQKSIVGEASRFAKKYVDEDQVYYWMVKLNQAYPGDIGVFSPIFLNLVHLGPGEAIYIPAGELHAYLHGVGIELMANSDNVLRGGLTPKHIDVPELLRVVDFKTEPLQIIEPVMHEQKEMAFPASAEEFLLSVISVDKEMPFLSAKNRSVEILICMKGESDIRDLGNGEVLSITKGSSVIVPSGVWQYRIEGNTTLYKASVPI